MFAGFVNDSLGYKWVFYVCAIIQSFGLVISFFFMEEVSLGHLIWQWQS